MLGIPMRAGVLVGGASSRMGRDKTRLPMPDGRTMLERTIDVIERAGLTPVLVGRFNRPASLAHIEHIEDAPCTQSAEPNGPGPIAGLLALLRHAEADAHTILLSCDLPHLSTELLKQLAHAPAADVAMPRSSHPQPLCARYRTSVKSMCERYFECGGRSLRGLLDELEVITIEAKPDSFRDWDTPDDVAKDLGGLPW